jgi:hypothetical protein
MIRVHYTLSWSIENHFDNQEGSAVCEKKNSYFCQKNKLSVVADSSLESAGFWWTELRRAEQLHPSSTEQHLLQLIVKNNLGLHLLEYESSDVGTHSK